MSNYSYDSQIAHLKGNPKEIYQHWTAARGVFKIIGHSMDEYGRTVGPSDEGGCLTMVKIGAKAMINGVVNTELTQRIVDDPRVPYSPSGITVDHLEIFKEYQELADSLMKPQPV